MTLGRWVRLYIFQPIAVPLTRFAAAQGYGKWPFHAVSVLLPLFLSMLIIGAWHGPNWTYVVFGAMHGTFQCINEIYNFKTRKARRKKPDGPAMLALYTGLTVLAFIVAEVPFRSADVPTALRIYGGMIGLNGLGLGVGPGWTADGLINVALILASFAIIYLLPNTMQLMDRFRPALEWDKWQQGHRAAIDLRIRISLPWAMFLATGLFLGVVFMSRGTAKFIYFAF